MRKMPAVALIVLAALAIGSAAPLMLRAQTGGAVRPGGATAAVDDLPHRTAKSFAPFIRALIQRRMAAAQQIFKMRRSVLNGMEGADVVRIIGRFQRPDRFDLNLVGGRMLGPNIGILLFTMANEDGPIFFKIYYYDFADQRYIDHIEISDDWNDLEAAAASVDLLQNSITVPLNPAEGM
jgi:hypothetical protein